MHLGGWLVLGLIMVAACGGDNGEGAGDAGPGAPGAPGECRDRSACEVGDTCANGDACEPNCTSGEFTYGGEEVWANECNSCSCVNGRAGCSPQACDAPPMPPSDSCAPSGACTEGPACGDTCCGPGERCNGWTCVCGEANRWCTDDQACGTIGTCGTECT